MGAVLVPVLRGGVGVQLAVYTRTGVECVLVVRCRVHVLDEVDLVRMRVSSDGDGRAKERKNDLTSPFSGQLSLCNQTWD